METIKKTRWFPEASWHVVTLASLLPLWLLSLAITVEGFPKPPIPVEVGIASFWLAIAVGIVLLWKSWLPPDIALVSLIPFVIIFNFDEISARYKTPFILMCALILSIGMIGAHHSEQTSILVRRRTPLKAGLFSLRSTPALGTALRAFFHFAEARGWCGKGLAASIRSPRIFSQTSVPLGPSWDDVQRLLTMTEDDKPSNIRARPILMLFVIYGLRNGEVCRLRLEDLAWEHGSVPRCIFQDGAHPNVSAHTHVTMGYRTHRRSQLTQPLRQIVSARESTGNNARSCRRPRRPRLRR